MNKNSGADTIVLRPEVGWKETQMAAARNYAVRCRDVDGSSVRYYAKLESAAARLIEMAGGSIEGHIAEHFYYLADAGKPLPKLEAIPALRAVGMYGNVVVLEAVSDEALAAVKAAGEAAAAEAAKDWAVVCEGPIYDNRDGICGSRRIALSMHASEAEASAALGKLGGPEGEDFDPDCGYYVARKSEGLRRPAPVLVPYGAGMDLEDIPF